MRKKMFNSLKLNSLKCQSNGAADGGGDNPRDKCLDDDGGDDLSDHMYEKLPNSGNKCKCHFDQFKRSPKPAKISFSKRISKWRMECPGITNLRNSHPEDGHESKNNQAERIAGVSNSEYTVRTKITTVNIEREDGNLGITLKGGFYQNSNSPRSVVITYVKPDGPAARQGTIKPGDRLLAVDGISLQGSTLNDAQTLLRQPSATALLTIEYNVNVLESVEHANGPLLVEIEKTSTQHLGLTLLQNEDGVITIERIKPGSLADRCGALHVGDEILAVNAIRLEGTSVALEDVMKILECEYPVVRLEILPYYAVSCASKCGTWKTKDFFESTSSTASTLKGKGSIRKNRDFKKEEGENGMDYKLNHVNSHGICGAEIALTHSETLHTTLTRENGGFGLQFVDAPDGSILINSVTPDGPAERSQCLHPGDRVLSVNHRNISLDTLTAENINELLEFKSDDSSCSKLILHTEFDVLDTVVPSSGIFLVKLVKRGSAGLGITITASKSSGFIVCEMKKGSIAHRAGSLVPGDRLLAINNVSLDQCSVEYAAHIFHQSTNIITLKVQREGNSDFRNCVRKITYTVDLQRYGGPLGITIAGSEEPSHPITISGLTAGGLAEQTGVIHVGDEILAINNHPLYGEPLSRAHALLQNSSDLVTLKLSRSLMQSCRLFSSRSPILPSSIDSAVESWGSSHLDLAPSPDHQISLRESQDDGKRNAISSQPWPSLETGFQSTSENPDSNSMNDNSGQGNSDLAILDKITSENLKIKHELDLLTNKLDEQRKSMMTQCETDSNAFLAKSGVTLPEENSLKPPETSSKSNSVEAKESTVEEDNFEERRSACNSTLKDLDGDYMGRESLMTADFEKFEMAYLPETRNWCKNQYFGCEGSQGSLRSEFQSSHLYEVTLYKDPIYEDFGFSVSDGLYDRGVFINRIRKGGPADLSNVLKPYDRILQVNKTNTQDFDCCLTVPLIASAGDSLVLLVARNPGNSNSENDGVNYENFFSKEMTASSLSSNKMEIRSHEDSRRILV